MLMSESIEYRRLRAPGQDGSTMIDPPLDSVAEMLATGARLRSAYDYDLQGRSLSQLAQSARPELIHAARQYTKQYRDVDHSAVDPAAPIVLAGHQPQLFHPGVWFKNFTLGAIAEQHAAVGINLLIDVDTIRDASLRVPGGSAQAPTVVAVPLDQPTDEVPYEQRPVVDQEMFATFGHRAAETIRPLVADPFISQLWPLAAERARAGANLGQCIAQARHQVEGQWGLDTLEIPQSLVCQLEAFHWFSAHLLANLPRFWEIYNAALAEYRRAGHIRSRSHPVPDLGAHDAWLEAPFWIWTDDDPRRRRLFACQRGDQLVLSDHHRQEIALDLSADAEAHTAVEQLADLARRGIKLRTRALATTMFARLVLGDLFLHGIGGAKYDQVNDQVMRRFFCAQPPAFLVASATLRLPIDRPRASENDRRQIDRLLRELEYHPEHYIDRTDARTKGELGDIDQVIQAKDRWVRTAQKAQNARQRHLEITRANATMQPWVAEKRRAAIDELEAIAVGLRAEAILSSREYSFCLHPEKTLRDFLLVIRRHAS